MCPFCCHHLLALLFLLRFGLFRCVLVLVLSFLSALSVSLPVFSQLSGFSSFTIFTIGAFSSTMISF